MGAVNSLNSTGQMIPLLLGVGAVTRDAYFAWAKTRPCPAPTPYGAAAEDGAGLPTGAMVLPPAAAAVKQV